MELNGRASQQPGRILVVGELGYHQENIILPIVHALERRGWQIDMVGRTMDFFEGRSMPNYLEGVAESVVRSIKGYRAVLFSDYWNFHLPAMLYQRTMLKEPIPFIGLFHGSVRLPEDVAHRQHHAGEYENYLLKAYNCIITPDRTTLFRENMAFSPFPTNVQRERIPQFRAVPRVIFAHRFDLDKGATVFLDFAERFGTQVECIATADAPALPAKNVTFVGRLPQRELANLASSGGYAWSSVKSETFSYTMLDLMSYGLTPLVYEHSAYWYIPNDFVVRSNHEAMDFVIRGTQMTCIEWDELMERIAHGDERIADIVEATCVA